MNKIKIVCAGSESSGGCSFFNCPFNVDIGYGHECNLLLLDPEAKSIPSGTTLTINLNYKTAKPIECLIIDGVKI